MKTSRIAMMLTLAVVFVLGAASVLAAEPGEAAVSNQANLGEYLQTVADTVTVEAGNITYADVDTNMSTYRWAGITGNVTGNIVLGDASNNKMFQWTAAGLLVYASQGATITWSSLADANEAAVTGTYTYLATGKSDAYDTTFTGAAESIGSNIFTALTSDYAQTYNNAETPTWKTYSLTDGSEFVFAGLVSAAGTNFAGTTVDYQMIVPEDGTAGDLTTQTYNLWVELE